MIYTPRMVDAVFFATQTHQLVAKPQYRKGKAVPYITHPLAVGLILARAGADEDVVIAGILHDVIEDCDPYESVTVEMLHQRFGAEVAMLVNSVTEQNKRLGWHERKEAALIEIQQFSNEALLLKSADVISNTTELILDFEVDGVATFERFNAPYADIITHTLLVIKTILEAWPESPLKGDLVHCHKAMSAMK